jgi:hypothetical protein
VRLCLQLLGRGTCINSTACNGMTSCQAWGGSTSTPDAAWLSPYFSSAIAGFSAGTHTVLIRVNNPNGCPTGRAGCFEGGNVLYRLDTCEGLGLGCGAALHCMYNRPGPVLQLVYAASSLSTAA